MSGKALTHQHLVEMLDYDPKTGVLRWKRSVRRRRTGDVAGSLHNRGYWCVRIDGIAYLAHRLAWFYVYRVWPKRLDHRDTDKLATASQNAANMRPRGHKGIDRLSSNRWRARCKVDRKTIHIGVFDTPGEASAAYLRVARRVFGEFARAS